MEPIPSNNEFKSAEAALRKIGSNLWFSGLSKEWQEFLIANTTEHFDTYELTMLQAAGNMLDVVKPMVVKYPEILEQNPWDTEMFNG